MECIIREFMEDDLESLNKLLKANFNVEKKKVNYCDSNIELVALCDDRVVGYLLLNKIYDSVKNLYYGYINYVCVDEKYRNQKIATNMFEHIFTVAHKANIAYLELTSNKKRISAHYLYEKMGFNIRHTDVFRKELL